MTDDESTLLSVPDDPDLQLKRFSHEEMITCESCLRANPPTRKACLYCGVTLPASAGLQTNDIEEVSGIQEIPKTAVESNGYYLVVSSASGEQMSVSSLEQAANRLQVKQTDLQNALSQGGALPLLYLETSEQASRLIDEFRALGLEAVSINDQDLSTSQLPKKIHAMEFSDRGVAGSNRTSGEQVFEAWDDLVLIVAGRLQSNKVELIERRKRGGQKPVDRRELSADEAIFDLYSRSNQGGWRIVASNFDFSSLGAKKGITAFENFRALIGALRERAQNLEVDESYLHKRMVLAGVWPLGEGQKTGGWRRSGTGKYDVSTVTITDNENQFNNYSRLVHLMKTRAVS